MGDQLAVPLEENADPNGVSDPNGASEADMRTRSQRLFSVEHVGETLIVVPMIPGKMFRYAQLQTEANALRRELDQSSTAGLILDLHALEYLGAEVIGAVVALARKVEDVGGRAVLCCAAPQLNEALKRMGLHRLWTVFPTRAEALAAMDCRN